jgi:hypothetical protein
VADIGELVPIDHTNVTVNGSKWRAKDPWDGLNFKRAEVREKSSLMVFLFGEAEAPPDHHLRVPWMHPEDRAAMADDPDYWAYYRVRPVKKRARFEKKRGKWLVRLPPNRHS